MNICIEGPDNSGKTTLVENLAQVYERQVRHATKPSSNEEALELFTEEVDQGGQFILDRSQAISGMLYDFHVRKQVPYFGMSQCEDLAWNTLLIICLPPKELVLADQERDQMPGVRENHEALYDAYADLATGSELGGNSIFVFDYTKHDLGDVIDWITDLLNGPLC